MNILYLSADSGIPVRGHKGAAVHIRAMCEAFVALGHHVTLVTARPDGEFAAWGEQSARLEVVSPGVALTAPDEDKENAARALAARTFEKSGRVVRAREIRLHL